MGIIPLESTILGNSENTYEQTNENTQETQQTTKQQLTKLKYGTVINFGTLNIRGIKRLGKREKVEHWMKNRNVKILLLQETHVNQNVREIRKKLHLVLRRKHQQKHRKKPHGSRGSNNYQ